ncbi:hypothetical protein MD484_g5198, partial [Candolleomyces efflorescens]
MTDYYLSFVPAISSPLVTTPPLSPESEDGALDPSYRDGATWSGSDLPDFLTVPRRGRRHWSEDAGRGLSVRYEVVKESKKQRDGKRRSLSVSLERLFCSGDGDGDGGESYKEEGEGEIDDLVDESRSWRERKTTRNSKGGRVISRVGFDTFDADFEYPSPHRRFHRHPNHVDDFATSDGQPVTFQQLLAEELLRLEAEEIMSGTPGSSTSTIPPESSFPIVSATERDFAAHQNELDDDSEELWFENANHDPPSQSNEDQRWGKFRSLSRLTQRRRTSRPSGSGSEGSEKEEAAQRSSSIKRSSTNKKHERQVETISDGEDIQSGCLPCSQGPFI